MKKTENVLKKIYGLCPVRWTVLFASLLLTGTHFILRAYPKVMHGIVVHAIRPAHTAMAVFWSRVHFSGSELILSAAAIVAAGYFTVQFFAVIFSSGRGRRILRILASCAAAVSAVYAGFCFLWGLYYYDEGFSAAENFEQGPISMEQLETTAEYFAMKLNEYSTEVVRDENGLYSQSRDIILRKSAHIFDTLQQQCPELTGPSIPAKGIYFSRIMSMTDFTGFFFPFTGEANVNMDFPPCLLAATAAHELSHQRGIAREQEANFFAVLASMESRDMDYCYSASMLAYIHLGNALYAADRQAWARVYDILDENIKKDLSANNTYWAQFETPVMAVSDKIYEGFLYSYDQQLGLRSYGACVDLLVNYYYEEAESMLRQ